MNKEMIMNLTEKWENATRDVLTKRTIVISDMQSLIRDTYKTYYEYHDKEMMPKEMGKLSMSMNQFLDFLVRIFLQDVYDDNVYHDTFCFIAEAIEYGFYKGKYKYNYPMLKVDNCNGGENIVNVEEDFLEELIDANR